MYRRRHDIALQPDRKAAVRSVAPKAAAPKAAPKAAAKAAPTEKVARRRRSKLDPYQDMLGKVPDAEVAAMAGVTSENVRAYRRRHKIGADWRGRAAAAPVAAAPVAAAPVAAAPVAAAPASSAALEGFAVVLDGDDEVYVVLAADIAGAAANAVAAVAARKSGGRIVGIERLGGVL